MAYALKILISAAIIKYNLGFVLTLTLSAAIMLVCYGIYALIVR